MSASRMEGERLVTISFSCSGFEAAILEDAIDDYYEASEANKDWVETGIIVDTTTDIRLSFFGEYLAILAGAALAQKRLNCIIKKDE